MSGKPSSTIGFERRYNVALREHEREHFIADILGTAPPKPATFAATIAGNRGL